MARVSRKTRKLKKSRITKTRQHGGYTTSTSSNKNPVIITITYSTSNDSSSFIQLVSPEVVDWTEHYKLKKLDKEPSLEINGLDADKKYLLVMTDPDALGKTWTHWVVLINGAGQIVKPAIVEYNGPSPPTASGVHHYIFRLYDMAVVGYMPSPLDSMSRGDYFAVKLKNIIKGKPVLAEATFTIDSGKIANKK
jgi:phosphatidylethanolamine-binding protein (PEBP) family uncharacterized protein